MYNNNYYLGLKNVCLLNFRRCGPPTNVFTGEVKRSAIVCETALKEPDLTERLLNIQASYKGGIKAEVAGK